MQKKIAILIAVSVTIILVMSEWFIVYLFPRFDIAGFFLAFFLLVFLPIGVGVGVFILLRQNLKRVQAGLIIMGMVIISVCIQFSLNPSSPNPWVETINYVKIYWNYPDNISYEDMAIGTRPEIIAASVKYKDSLPDRVAIIEIHDKSAPYSHVTTKYWAELRGNKVTYNINAFLLQETDGYVYLITNPNSSEHEEYKLTASTIANLFELYSGGGDMYSDVYAHDFKLQTGAEKLFVKILSLR